MKSPYVQGLKQGFAELSVYSLDFLFGLFQAVALVGFEILLWTFVLPADNQAALFERTSYFLLANGIALVIGGARYRFARDLSLVIKEGTLSHYLLKPINPVFYIYSEHVGGKGPDFMIGLIFIIMGTLWIPTFTLIKLPLLLITLITALINTISLNVIAGAVAFWTTEAGGIKNAFAQTTRLFNGQQVPINLFMEMVRPFWAQFLYILPFASVAYTPTHIVVAKTFDAIDFRFIIASIIWAFILPLLATLIWNRGLKRYEGTGL